MVRRFSCTVLAATLAAAVGCSGPKPTQDQINQYRQMGGINSLAVDCFNSDEILTRLNELTASVQGDDKAIMDQLIDEFNEGGKKATADKVIWNGTKGAYSETAFSCSNPQDLEQIQNMAQAMLSSLR